MPIVRPVAVRPIRSRSHPIVKIPALLRPLTPLPVPIRCRLPRHAKPTDIPPNLSRTLRTSTHPRLPQRMRLRHPSPLRMRLKNPHLTRLTINPVPHRHHPVIPMPHHQRLHHIALTNQRHAAPRRRQHTLGHSRRARTLRQHRHFHHSTLRSPDRRKLQPDHLHQIPPPRRPAPRTPRMIIHRQLEPPPRILRQLRPRKLQSRQPSTHPRLHHHRPELNHPLTQATHPRITSPTHPLHRWIRRRLRHRPRQRRHQRHPVQIHHWPRPALVRPRLHPAT